MTREVRADGESVYNGSSLKVEPPLDESWLLESTFADNPDAVEMIIIASGGTVTSIMEPVKEPSNGIPINSDNYVEFENTSSSQSMSYHAVKIG